MELTSIKKVIQSIGSLLGPDEDWMPVVILEKDTTAAAIGIPVMSDKSKDMVALLIQAMIQLTNPDAATFISTGWLGEPIESDRFMSEEDFDKAYEDNLIPRPSLDPDRREVVIVVSVNSNGDSYSMYGVIKRSKKAPEISNWKELGGSKSEDVKGRFADAMRRGFELVDENGTLKSLDKIPFLTKEKYEQSGDSPGRDR
jgi:hypothetical protein